MAVTMCLTQHKSNRYSVLTQAAKAASWQKPSLEKLAKLPGMRMVEFDLEEGGERLTSSRRTMIYTNSEAIDGLVERECGGVAKRVTMTKFVDAVPDGLTMQTSAVLMDMGMETICDPVEEEDINRPLRGVDDVSGEDIDPILIQ